MNQVYIRLSFGYLRIRRTELMDVLLDAANKAEIPVHFNKGLTTVKLGRSQSNIAIPLPSIRQLSEIGTNLLNYHGHHFTHRASL